jgi:hypothetical protein
MSRFQSSRAGYIPLYTPPPGSPAYYGQMYPSPRGSRSVRRSVRTRSPTSPFVYNFSPAPGGTVLVPMFTDEVGNTYFGVTPQTAYVNPYANYYPYEDEPLRTAQPPIVMGKRELGAAKVLGDIYGQRGGSPTYYQPVIQELRSQHARKVASRRPGFAGLLAAQGGAAAGTRGASLMARGSRTSRESLKSSASQSRSRSRNTGSAALRASRSAQ